MTRDEILNMTAGKRMRDMAAIYVMKWKLVDPNDTIDERLKQYWIDPISKDARSVESWHPDENMVDAWEVVKQFEKFYIETDKELEEVFAMVGDDFGTAVHSATAPLAICRAALLAALEDEE